MDIGFGYEMGEGGSRGWIKGWWLTPSQLLCSPPPPHPWRGVPSAAKTPLTENGLLGWLTLLPLPRPMG